MSETDNTLPGWFAEIKTKPLSHTELSGWFDISTRHVGELLGSIDGVEKIGRRWRVPVREMPPGYLLKEGLIVPMQTKPDVRGHSCITSNLSTTTFED